MIHGCNNNLFGSCQIDLKEIYHYIRRNSPFFAQKEVNDIRAEIKSLKSNLFLGHQFHEGNDELTREMVFRNYRIIYEISENQQRIQILTIHHHSRLLSNNAAFDSEED